MNPRPPPVEPPRLRESNDRVGALLRRVLAEPHEATPGVAPEGWDRIAAALAQKSRSPRIVFAYALASVLVVVVLAVPFSRGGLGSLFRDRDSTALGTLRSASSQPKPAEVAILVGEHQTRRLGDGTVISVPTGGRARVTYPSATRTLVQLDQGAVELVVSPRKADELLEVQAGRYHFRVMGTRFRVAQDNGGLVLSVTEGRVAVLERGEVLQIVEAGGSWTELPPAPGSSSTQPAPQPAPATSRLHVQEETEQVDCLAAARGGEHAAALACFERQARGNGVAAEVALYESARIYHELLGKASQALSTLDTYRRRFPNGTLWAEASLKATQLLVELGKDEQALDESGELLRSGRLQSRDADLRFLRGRLYQRRGNFARAADEYAKAAVSTTAQSDRARLERADCLEALGRIEEAQRIYQELSRSRHAHLRAEALRRLDRLHSRGEVPDAAQ